MEVDRFETREVFRLDLVESAGQEVRHPLEDRCAGEDEVAVARIVRVAGLIEVKDVHEASPWPAHGTEEELKKKKAADGSFEPRAPQKGGLSVAPSY